MGWFPGLIEQLFPVILVEGEPSLKRFFEERPIFPFGVNGDIC